MKRIKNRDGSSAARTRLVLGELKTPKSRRTLALTPEIMARFRQHRARQRGPECLPVLSGVIMG
jgi:hypothetical protein